MCGQPLERETMKFKIARLKLLDALQRVQNVVTTRTTLQILSNALIKAEGNQLQITTTDLDISVRCTVEAEVSREGGTTLPIRNLASIVRELPADELEIDISDDDVASVQSGPSHFKIIGLPMRDFPPITTPESNNCFRVDGGAFKEMLRKTAYAVSTDESRRALTGLLLSFKEGKLTMVATDGRRLALVEQEVEFPPEAEVELILPRKSVSELLRILRDDDALTIFALQGQAIFESAGTLFCTKLIDGVYPNYRQVIPSGCDERAVVGREELLNALRRVSLVITEKVNSVKMTFADNVLAVGTPTTEIGEAHETLPIKYSGKEVVLSFNPEYAMDPLRNLTNDEIYIEMSNGHSPALIKCDLPFLYVLMPLRLG